MLRIHQKEGRRVRSRPPVPGRRAARSAAAGSATSAPGPDWAVGGREWLGLPEFGIACIQATLDPDGEESTLLASDVVVAEEDGEWRARFSIRPIAGDDRTIVVAEAPLRPAEAAPATAGSAGPAGDPVIRTLVTLDQETWPVDLRLVAHHPRRLRLHLGRDALGGRFNVLAHESFLAGPPATGRYREGPS